MNGDTYQFKGDPRPRRQSCTCGSGMALASGDANKHTLECTNAKCKKRLIITKVPGASDRKTWKDPPAVPILS